MTEFSFAYQSKNMTKNLYLDSLIKFVELSEYTLTKLNSFAKHLASFKQFSC